MSHDFACGVNHPAAVVKVCHGQETHSGRFLLIDRAARLAGDAETASTTGGLTSDVRDQAILKINCHHGLNWILINYNSWQFDPIQSGLIQFNPVWSSLTQFAF